MQDALLAASSNSHIQMIRALAPKVLAEVERGQAALSLIKTLLGFKIFLSVSAPSPARPRALLRYPAAHQKVAWLPCSA